MIDFFSFYTASLLWNVGNGEDIVPRTYHAATARRLRSLPRSLARSLAPSLAPWASVLPCLLIVCERARDPYQQQRGGSRIDLSILRDGSKKNLGIIALERSVFFL
jgi:hypothetical protein